VRARVVAAAGMPVRVLDRARAVGGRMASRRLHGRPVDLGAAYFTVRDEEFAEVVERWRAAGLARPWTDEPAVLGGPGRDRAPGPMRWAAPAGLRSLVTDLSDGLDVRLASPVERSGRVRRSTAQRPTPWCWRCPIRRPSAWSTPARRPRPSSPVAGGAR
jgi:predicted NAD/FAD-dependent oxidoreductase